MKAARFRPSHFLFAFAAAAATFELAFVACIGRARWFEVYLGCNAAASAFLLRAAGVDATHDGRTLRTAARGIELERGCDALEVTSLFCIAVVLFPAPALRKATAVLVAAGVFSVLNLARIVTLALAQLHRPQVFETLHVMAWPAFLIAVAVGLWVIWARRATLGTTCRSGV